MSFVDTARIFVASGKGGDGLVSFRREKFVPKGGPDGGNGGRGGDIVIKVDPHINTLLDFRFKRKFIADDGRNGDQNNSTGKSGKPIIIKVPRGTIVRNAETGEVLADLIEKTQETILLQGGYGGRGNGEFATSINQTPRHRELGKPGTELYIDLEMKLLADVGLVGFPNVGKSTLISVISAAKPKIADYPFTTLIPNLGIVRVDVEKSFTVADIPGLIEGASDGKGLGSQFLRHVERTRVLVFLIDANSPDPVGDYKTLCKELYKHNPAMEKKKRLLCISKIDTLNGDSELYSYFQSLDFGDVASIDVISSITRENVDALVWKMWDIIGSTQLEDDEDLLYTRAEPASKNLLRKQLGDAPLPEIPADEFEDDDYFDEEDYDDND